MEGKKKKMVFECQMDIAGRIAVPAHIRRETGTYRRAALVKVEMEVKKVYGEDNNE